MEKENKEFVPTDLQKEACKKAKLNLDEFQSSEDLNEALSKRGYIIDGENIITPNENSATMPQEGQDDKSNATDEDNGLTVDGNTGDTVDANINWVDEKAQHYQNIYNSDTTTQELKNDAKYERITNETIGFKAKIFGATIHYTSKDHVCVSDEADLKVYAALLKEPHNQGRPINFGEHLSDEQKLKLYAACLLNDAKIGQNAPQLTAENLEAIKNMLSEEEWKKFANAHAQRLEAAQTAQTQQTANVLSDDDKEKVAQGLKDELALARLNQKDKSELSEDENKKLESLESGQKDRIDFLHKVCKEHRSEFIEIREQVQQEILEIKEQKKISNIQQLLKSQSKVNS